MPRMIGLHHHMSYSPASASQSRLGPGDVKTNKSKSANRNGGQSQSQSSNNSNNSKRQQFVLAELADDSIRALRVHKIREERTHHTDVVQVSAQTVMPTIVVESVPKSRPSAGARPQRHHHQTTAHDAAGGGGGGRRAREPSHQQPQHQLYRNDEDQQRHFLLHEQQRRERQSNQVVLIMSDTSSLAGTNCVPIIGRRLPSKSFGDHPMATSGGGISELGRKQAAAAPVVGRRSHRLLDQQQQQQQAEAARLFRVSERDAMAASRNAPLKIHQGPLDIIEAHTIPGERIQMLGEHPAIGAWPEAVAIRSTARSAPAKKKSSSKKNGVSSSNSCSSLAKFAGQQADMGPVASDLCLDACCRRAIPPVATNRMPASDGYSEPLEDPLGLCMMPCCRLVESPLKPSSVRSSSSSNQQTRRGRERDRSMAHPEGLIPYDQSHKTCQANGPAMSMVSHHQSQHLQRRMPAMTRRSSSLCRSDELGPMAPPMPADHHNRHPLSRRAAAQTGSLLNAVAPRHLDVPGYQQIDSWRLKQQPPPVPYKPSHKYAAGSQLLQQKHLEQLKLQQLEQEQDSSAVTQMYESLAAELKAKLGNPNRAPILLPPKDYDTLSRKQGKLNGIESRRSTNPQLVGPTVARVPTSSSLDKPNSSGSADNGKRQQTISEEICCDRSPVPSTGCSSGRVTTSDSSAGSSPKIPADSARSSGRSSRELDQNSQYDHPSNHSDLQRVDSLQRSRSNSSSGLGSISISASSPDQNARSSPSHSSGSETDMTTMRHLEQENGSGLFQAKLANDEFIMFGSSLKTRTDPKRQASEASAVAIETATDTSPTTPTMQDTTRALEGKNQTVVASSKAPADGHLWNGRVEVPLKVNNDRRNGNTYLATKQIIY